MRYFLISEDRHTLTGLRLAGVEGTLVSGAEDVLRAMEAAEADETIAVLLLTPGAAAMAPEAVEQRKIRAHRPLLTVIPASDGKGLGDSDIQTVIRQSMGVKL